MIIIEYLLHYFLVVNHLVFFQCEKWFDFIVFMKRSTILGQ